MQVMQGETWRFQVQCRGAERVYLVREPEIGPSAWIEMQTTDRDHWEVTHCLLPGRYRFRYFRADGTTFVNCGDHGLVRERIADVEPAVATTKKKTSGRYAVPA